MQYSVIAKAAETAIPTMIPATAPSERPIGTVVGVEFLGTCWQTTDLLSKEKQSQKKDK